MQIALKEMSTFDVDIRDYLLGLLNNDENLTHTPQRAKYPQLTLTEALITSLKLKQGDKVSLLHYYGPFKSEKNVAEILIGKKLIDGFTEETVEFKALPAGLNS